MRRSFYAPLVALGGALFAGACSNSFDPTTGPSGEWLITQLSANQAAPGDSVAVTVTVYNPTGHQLTLVYGSRVPTVLAQQGDGTYGSNGGGPIAPDTISLPPTGQVVLGPVMVHIQAPGVYTSPPSGEEALSLAPGVYGLEGCVSSWGLSPEGGAWIVGGNTCGPGVNFTVTQ
jgi:hypothetical protein